jgi:hypothetical protein
MRVWANYKFIFILAVLLGCISGLNVRGLSGSTSSNTHPKVSDVTAAISSFD